MGGLLIQLAIDSANPITLEPATRIWSRSSGFRSRGRRAKVASEAKLIDSPQFSQVQLGSAQLSSARPRSISQIFLPLDLLAPVRLLAEISAPLSTSLLPLLSAQHLTGRRKRSEGKWRRVLRDRLWAPMGVKRHKLGWRPRLHLEQIAALQLAPGRQD